jgi:MFS transporter, DHA1 family, inner membrane transport protein
MTTPARTRSNLALFALALGSFTIGTAELLIVGILNIVAKGTGVSISTAGLLVTGYALGIAIGGPLVTALTIRLGRRLMLLLALGVYIAGNVVAATAADFGMLVTARIVTGSIHGLFIGVASAVAASLVPPDHRGRAMSMVFGGIAVSAVAGVPLGTLIGQAMGWRAAFVAVAILGAAALVSTLLLVPVTTDGGAGGVADQARSAFAPRVLAMLAVGFLLMGSQFTAFTYLTPFIQRVTGISGTLISAFVLAFGLASAAGTFAGGRFADRSASGTLTIANAWLILSLALLYVAGRIPALAIVALIAWGLPGFGLIPALQLRIISLAGPGADLAATLGASAVNAGIAVGAVVGGWVVSAYGVRSVALAALILCAIALPATIATRWLRVPSAAASQNDQALTEVKTA